MGSPEGWPVSLRTLVRYMLASAGPKLLLWGPDFLTFHNDAYRTMLGVHGMGIGRRFAELRPDIWDFVRPHVEAAFNGESRLLIDHRGLSRRTGQDEIVYVTLCYTPVFDADGTVIAVLGDVYDTSPVHRARAQLMHENERLTEVFTRAPFLIAFSTAPDMRITYANDAFAAFYGNRPLAGLPVAEAIPEAVEQGFLAMLEHVYRTGEPWIGKNVPVTVRNPPDFADDLRYVDFIYQPLHEADGSVTGIACFGYDETENKRAQEHSVKLQTQLLHGARVNAMGTMAMTLAHELNQPLTAAANYLSVGTRLLASGAPQREVVDALTLVEEEIQRTGEIIRRIRDMVSAGRSRAESVSLHKALANAHALLSAGSETFRIEVEREIPDEAECVLFDRVQLEQILVNLLRNAAEASADAGAEAVRVTATRDKRMVTLRLRDWGRGIDPTRMPTLFEALQPVSATGLGMGLSLCRTMVEAHGGSIWAEAPEGGGTSIALTLPAAGRSA
ncbi:MAG TPA: ATP-binding protein [Allosphingosinicella sp.]